MKKNTNINNYQCEYPIFDNTVVLDECCFPLISKSTGVYFFHDLRGVHYIGETVNLRSRLKQHLKIEKNKELIEAKNTSFGQMLFSWVKTNSKLDALRLQKKWIRIFQPKCNNIKFKHAS